MELKVIKLGGPTVPDLSQMFEDPADLEHGRGGWFSRNSKFGYHSNSTLKYGSNFGRMNNVA